MSDASLIIPGLIQVGAYDDKKRASLVQIGSAVGWTMPRGINTWRREVSVVNKGDLTPDLLNELGVVLPEQQGEPAAVARARRAAEACSLVAVEGPIAEQLMAKGLVVHTVGFDSVSGGFFYLAKGGKSGGKKVQGELIEMVASSLGDGSNDELEASLDGILDRLLVELSEGVLSEVQIELADALPPLGPKNRMGAARLQGLEGWLILTSSRSGQFEVAARQIASDLRAGLKKGGDLGVAIPLFGEARQVVQPPLEITVTLGDEGGRAKLTLPAHTRWLVTGKLASPSQAPAAKPATGGAVAPSLVAKEAAAREAASKEAAAKEAAAREAAAKEAATKKAVADKEARERAATEKLLVEKQAAEQAEARKVAAERAASERAAAERAAAKAVAAREAAEKAAAEKAESEKAAAEKAAAEKAAAEKAAAEKAAAEKAESEKAAAEKAAAEKATEEREAEERASAEKAAAKKAREGEAASEKRDKKGTDKKGTDKKDKESKPAAASAASSSSAPAPKTSLPLIIGLLIVLVAVLAVLAMFKR